jgi:hypothetical protein
MLAFVGLDCEIADVKLLRLTAESKPHSAYEPAGVAQDYIFREVVVEDILIGVFLDSQFGPINARPE